MVKKCPEGVICIENVTSFIIVLIVGAFIFFYMRPQDKSNEKIIINEIERQSTGLFSKPNYSFSNIPSDVLLNPYQAPLRDDRYFVDATMGDPRGIPINIATRSVDTNYRQVGILKRLNGKEMVLPLMGRPLFTNRDKWNFYTLNENNVKLPITFKQRSCTGEYGCDNIYNNDTVYVDGLDAPFKATIYDNATMKYLPFL
jgi:hypothetical protein